MRTYRLQRTQVLPIPRDEAWRFFSSPENLGKITPPRMNFVILAQSGGKQMFSGQLIKYKISVLPFIRLTWVTEITSVIPHLSFTDEQRVGPYALWRHTHRFNEVAGGTEMTDAVEYALPLGWLGRLAHALFVEREVNRIFEYRFKVLATYFHKP